MLYCTFSWWTVKHVSTLYTQHNIQTQYNTVKQFIWSHVCFKLFLSYFLCHMISGNVYLRHFLSHTAWLYSVINSCTCSDICKSCHMLATCKSLNGSDDACYCNHGYTGDGIHSCNGKIYKNMKSKMLMVSLCLHNVLFLRCFAIVFSDC